MNPDGLRRRLSAVPRGAVVVLIAFFALRIAYWITGGGFSTTMLRGSWQLLDIGELAAHPLQSVTLLHIQPPLFNLFVGSILRWNPFPDAVTFQILYLGCGLAMVLALRSLLVELGFSSGASTTGAVVVAVNPILLSYENTITYEYPVAMLLVLAALTCARYARRRTLMPLVGLVLALTAIVLTRALLHPVWLVIAIVVVLVAARPRVRRVQVAGVLLIPVVLVGAVFIKNQVLFDQPTMSSWFGMNLGRGVIASMPRDDIDALIRSGDLSPAARIAPFTNYDVFAEFFGPCRTHFREPVVRSLTRRDGISNLNAACYLPVFDDAQTNALHAIRERPGAYFRQRWPSFVQHFAVPPAHDLAPGISRFGANPILKGIGRAYEAALVPVRLPIDDRGWAVPVFSQGTRYDVRFSLVLLFGTLLVVGRGGVGLVALLRRRGRPESVAWVFIALTIGYVAVVSIATEYGENSRFRTLLDPLVLGILAAQVVALISRTRSLAPPFSPTFVQNPGLQPRKVHKSRMGGDGVGEPA